MRLSAQVSRKPLPGERQRHPFGEVAAAGGGELRDLRLEPAVLGDQPFEPREIPRLARLDEAGEGAQRRRRHGVPRSRAARRIRSAKRIAAATAR